MEYFTSVQIFIIGVAAMAVSWLIAQFLRAKIILPDWAVNVIVYFIALALSAAWIPFIIPPLDWPPAGPVEAVTSIIKFLGDLLIALGPSVAFANLIYLAIKERLNKSRFASYIERVGGRAMIRARL